MSTDGTE